MVCKEDVVLWFKTLRSHNRIDVMCALLNLCLPFELRFLGTCLEDLGKRDFHDLRKTENEANNLSDIANEIQCISDKRTRPKLAFYISLLHSCNYSCCNSLFKILGNIDEVNALLKSPTVLSPDDDTLEELLLIYTLALNHPAFSFEQKLCLGNIFTRLQEEENKRTVIQERSLSNSTVIDSINDKIQSCPSSEDRNVHNAVSNTSHCPPPFNSVASHLTGEPVINLHDPLNSSSYHVRLAAYQPPLVGGHASWPGMMLPPEPTTSPSPLISSRTSSPCQSNSPSRAGSPGRPKPSLSSGPFTRPPPVDPLRETIGKEMPNFLANLQDYSIDQLRQMCDDELRELGLPNGAVYQLRSIVNKLQATNGITNLIDTQPTNNNNINSKKKIEGSEPEVPVMRPYGNILETPPMMFRMAQPTLNYTFAPCIGCLGVGPRTHKSIHHNIYCLGDQMRALHLEAECPSSLHGSNSSASDSASDHSPPDTPSLSTVPDRGPLSKEQGEVWAGGDERDQRVGMPVENSDDRRPNSAHLNSQQARARGVGRSRSNPPGIQTLPRGRGLHPTAPRRRDVGSNSVNGVPEERKVIGTNEVQPFPFNPGAPVPAPPYIPAQFIRAATAAGYPAFHPNSYVRPSYPFPHPNSGDFVYQYPPPSQTTFLPPGPGPVPAPQPAPITYSAIVPPPKNSCYNCGSQTHLPSDCQESTIEEVSKQGQYRIDYTPYQKSGESSSTSNNSEK